ncbi:hypothetical protein ACN47E_005726 [Coniothyrium glycines]
MKSSDPIRPSSRRGASGAWNRLKPVREDPLESYGLPSKGETRLNDFKTQETYFNRVIERYMKLCALNREELDRLFASVSQLTTSDTSLNASFSSLSLSKHAPKSPAPATTESIPSNALKPSIDELSTVLAALRKLREAITASNRCDTFARRAYYFAIHVSILCHDWASYIPALHSLLQKIHPRNPLPVHDLKEYVSLLILDQACRQADFHAAFATRLHYGVRDFRVDAVLKALVHDNWVMYWRLKKSVDGYQRALMEFGGTEVRLHALKCLGKTYMSADKGFVERSAGKGWEELKEEGVGWDLVDGERVAIRKPKS